MAPMQTAGLTHSLPPSANITETEAEYVIDLDVSDFAEQELTVTLDGNELTVLGDQQEAAVDATESFRLHERLEESFRLPEGVDGQRLTALFDHGTLEIHAPKRDAGSAGPRTIPVVRKGHGLFHPDVTGS